MRNSHIALVAAILLLATTVMNEALPVMNQTDRPIRSLREVLLQNSWEYNVRLGRVAIETRVLMFREAGEMTGRVFDDTGMHEAKGGWHLEESDGANFLVLTGQGLRDKGRFKVRLDPKGAFIELQETVGNKRVFQFNRRKGL